MAGEPSHLPSAIFKGNRVVRFGLFQANLETGEL